MLSYFDALSTIEDNFSKFNDWVLYLNNELKLHLPNQKNRLSVFTVVFKKECEDLVFDCFSNMKKYTNKAAAQHKDDSVYSNIHSIDSLFVKLNAHESKFELSSVKAIFKAHNISWNEKEFKLLKESSNVAISILQSFFEKHLPDYFNSSIAYLSQENKENLIKYTKTSFIKSIVSSILNNEPLPVKFVPQSIENKTSPIKTNSLHSFRINVSKHEKFGKINEQLLTYEINESIKDMMIKLISYGYLWESTKINQFRRIFSGEIVKEKIKWKGKNNHLSYFISELYRRKLEKVYGDKKWIIASVCFDIGEEEENFSDKFRKAGREISDTHKNQLDTCINQIRGI